MREEDAPEELYTVASLRLSRSMVERIDAILVASSGRLWELLQGQTPAQRPSLRPTWSAEERRLSPLGQSLLVMAAFVEREFWFEPPEVERAIQLALRLLYGHLEDAGYSLPKEFHQTELGRLVDEARWHLYGYQAFLGPTEAAREVGVSRQSVYDRIADGKLLAIHAPSGEQRVLRADLEAWKAERAEPWKSSR